MQLVSIFKISIKFKKDTWYAAHARLIYKTYILDFNLSIYEH